MSARGGLGTSPAPGTSFGERALTPRAGVPVFRLAESGLIARSWGCAAAVARMIAGVQVVS